MPNQLVQVLAEVLRGQRMVDDAGDLDLMHREDHRRGAAITGEGLADLRQVGDGQAHPAEFQGDVAAQEFGGPERLEGLPREPPFCVDSFGVGRDRLAADVVDLPEEGRKAFFVRLQRELRHATLLSSSGFPQCFKASTASARD